MIKSTTALVKHLKAELPILGSLSRIDEVRIHSGLGCDLPHIYKECEKLGIPFVHESTGYIRLYFKIVVYITQAGESVMGIALRELKDENRWPEIIALNQRVGSRDFSDMGPHDYYPVNTGIKLPEVK